MQIKTNQTTKRISNTDLVRRWLEMTLPPIMGFLLLPYLFLFLGSLYSDEFHNIPAQTLLVIAAVQGLLVFISPIVTAWITLRRVSKQLQILAQVISQSAEKIGQRTFATDHWAALEKQQDDIGITARNVKAALLERTEGNDSAKSIQTADPCFEEDSETQYSSLFSLKMQEPNTQIY